MPLFLPSVPLSGGTMTGPLVIGGGTVTASTPVLDLSQTWNLAGTTFTGDKLNITDSASASGSLIIDRQIGGVSRFSVTKAGLGSFSSGLKFTYLDFGATGDTFLQRGAANTLDFRNLANAQTWNIYGTADAGLLNYRRLRTTMTTGGAATISAEGLGTGVSGNSLAFATDGSSRLTISSTISTTVATALGGTLNFNDGINSAFATTTGTKLGTATTQKLGFWNATPIVQPSSTGETVGFTAGGGTAVTDSSTFTGNVGSTAYRLSDIVKHLKNSGLLAS